MKSHFIGATKKEEKKEKQHARIICLVKTCTDHEGIRTPDLQIRSLTR
jgi:hypothetical protein